MGRQGQHPDSHRRSAAAAGAREPAAHDLVVGAPELAAREAGVGGFVAEARSQSQKPEDMGCNDLVPRICRRRYPTECKPTKIADASRLGNPRLRELQVLDLSWGPRFRELQVLELSWGPIENFKFSN